MKLDSLVVLMNLAPRRGVTMNGERLQRDGRGELEGITQGFHATLLPVHHLHLGNNNVRKASKEVHMMLVTPEKNLHISAGKCVPSLRAAVILSI